MISTKGRYGLRVMIDLAEHADEGCIPLKEIADRQGISKKYLEIIVKELVTARLVSGVSGKGGGYRLCKRPEEYSVGEILESLEGPMSPVACLYTDAPPCDRASSCQTLPLWAEYDQLIHDFFFSKQLNELTKQN